MASHSLPRTSLAQWLRLPLTLLQIRWLTSPSQAAIRVRSLEERYSRRLTYGPLRVILAALRRRAQHRS